MQILLKISETVIKKCFQKLFQHRFVENEEDSEHDNIPLARMLQIIQQNVINHIRPQISVLFQDVQDWDKDVIELKVSDDESNLDVECIDEQTANHNVTNSEAIHLHFFDEKLKK